MNIFEGFECITDIKNPVLTIGTFDGVHLGHQKIIQQLSKAANEIGGSSVLFTFYPHPKMVLFPTNHGVKLIQTQSEKLKKLEQLGLQNIIIQPFTKDFSNLTAEEFVRDFLVAKLKIQKLIVGYDHQFGKNREGNFQFLLKASKIYNFEVVEICAQEIDEVNVSSTKIRHALTIGDIKTANSYLGEEFELTGIVSKGNQLGRTIGFPTANIEIEKIKIIPHKGVYAVEVTLENLSTYIGMLNIGVRPTLGNENLLSIEVNIFDFDENIYDQTISIRIRERIRDELKFNSLDELKLQLQKDETTSRAILSSVRV